MEWSVAEHGDVTVIGVSGSLDSLTESALSAVFDETIAAGRVRLVVEYSNVGYTSSAGLRALLAALKGARRGGGDLRLAAPQKNVLKVLQLSGFTSILKTYETVEDAIASFTAGQA